MGCLQSSPADGAKAETKATLVTQPATPTAAHSTQPSSTPALHDSASEPVQAQKAAPAPAPVVIAAAAASVPLPHSAPLTAAAPPTADDAASVATTDIHLLVSPVSEDASPAAPAAATAPPVASANGASASAAAAAAGQPSSSSAPPLASPPSPLLLRVAANGVEENGFADGAVAPRSPGSPTDKLLLSQLKVGSMERRNGLKSSFSAVISGESQRRASMSLQSNDPEALAKQLLKASRAGMIEDVVASLDLAPSVADLVSYVDTDYEGALHKAASQGHAAVVAVLLEAGSASQTQNKDGRTPIMVAAEAGHREVCRLLVSSGGAAKFVPPRVLYTIGNAHTQRITSIALSRDGRRMLTASHDETLRLWHAEDAQQVALVGKHKHHITCCAFMQHAPGAVSSCGDNTVTLWDLFNLSPPDVAQHMPGASPRISLPVSLSLLGHNQSVLALALSPSGGLLTASADGTVKCWDISKPPQVRPDVKLVYNLSGHGGKVRAVAVSADGQLAASGSDDKLVRLWDLRIGACVHVMPGHTAPVLCCVFAPDGRRILSASEDKTLIVWDVRSGLQRHVLTGHTAAVTTVSVSADSTTGYSASLDTTIRVWDLVGGKELVCLRGHRLPLTALSLSPDGQMLAMGSEHILKAIQLQLLPGLQPWHAPQLAHLATAAQQGSTRLALMLLSTGIDPEAGGAAGGGGGGWAGLLKAAEGQPEVVELLQWWRETTAAAAAAAAAENGGAAAAKGPEAVTEFKTHS